MTDDRTRTTRRGARPGRGCWRRGPDGSAVRWAVTLPLLPALAAPPLLAGVQQTDPAGDSPAAWETVRPGGETGCARGGPYQFYVRPGDPDRVLVFFEGGGACWDGDTCDPDREEPVYTSSMGDSTHPRLLSGVFDAAHPANPVGGFTMVFGPYCTGDVHLGDRIATYETAHGPVTVRHRGFANATAVLDWVTEHVPNPETIVVAGSSAGAVGAPVHASRLARQYPNARVVGLSDGAGSYRSGALPDVDPAQWGLPEVLAATPGWQGYDWDRFGIETLTAHAAGTADNLGLAQFDQARDAAQRFYLDLAGNPDPDVQGLLETNRAELEARIPGFAGYTVGGVEHTVLGLPQLYFYTVGDRRLADWVAAVVGGEATDDPSCDPCARPTLSFAAADLALLDAALGELSSVEAWDPAQPGDASCPVSAPRRSLWCAVVAAAAEVGEASPLAYAATWEAAYEAMSRMGDDVFDQPLTRYNNDPATGYAEIVDLLRTVRATVAARLAG